METTSLHYCHIDITGTLNIVKSSLNERTFLIHRAGSFIRRKGLKKVISLDVRTDNSNPPKYNGKDHIIYRRFFLWHFPVIHSIPLL